MPEAIVDGTGSGFMAGVTDENRLKVDVAQGVPPTEDNNPAWEFLYIISGTAAGITLGSSIGSIFQSIGAGSFIQTITYSNNNITTIGSWVVA